jgi:hypothetical protein
VPVVRFIPVALPLPVMSTLRVTSSLVNKYFRLHDHKYTKSLIIGRI